MREKSLSKNECLFKYQLVTNKSQKFPKIKMIKK